MFRQRCLLGVVLAVLSFVQAVYARTDTADSAADKRRGKPPLRLTTDRISLIGLHGCCQSIKR